MRRIIFQITMVCFGLVLLCGRGEADALLQVDEEGLLSGRLERVNLTEVRRFFEQSHGIKFYGQDFLFQTNVTVSFEKLTLEQALKRILTRKNYAFKYDNQGALLAVTVLPGSGDTPESIRNNALLSNNPPQAEMASPGGLLKKEDDVADDITTFKPVKMEQKEFGVQVVKDNPLFEVKINSPPVEKKQ